MAAEIQNTTSSSNHSPSNSQSSSTHPPPPSQPSFSQKEELPEEEEASTAMDAGCSSLPDDKPLVADSLRCFTAEEILKYDKYEAGYASYLRAKFFSDKDIYGGDIYDVAVTVGNETIKASRWSPTRSYADPARSFVDSGNVLASEEVASKSRVESSSNIPNGIITPPKKSC